MTVHVGEGTYTMASRHKEDLKPHHPSPLDNGAGALEEYANCTPECPHCADKGCSCKAGGIGSGSLTAKNGANPYKG